MKLETILYSGKKIAGIREWLPNFVKDAVMMKVPYHLHDPTVLEFNINSQDAIKYLDKEFGELISIGQCQRKYNIEIDRKEIPNYSYFDICPADLEYGKYVIADVQMPTCATYNESYEKKCNIGSKLLSPIKVKYDKARKLDIATFDYPWGKEVVLLLSARMKNIFELAEIRGLIYEPTEFFASVSSRKFERIDGVSRFLYKDKPVVDAGSVEAMYVARPSHAIYSYADKVFFTATLCPVHLVPTYMLPPPEPLNCKIHLKDIGQNDIVQIQGVKVGSKIYNYNYNKIIFGRKPLELLLEHKAKGLRQVGIFIKSKFSPVTEIV